SCAHDLSSVRLMVWDSLERRWNHQSMKRASQENDPVYGPVEYWEAGLPIPREPALVYYFFEIRDQGDVDYYVDLDRAAFPGGTGQMIDEYDEWNTFQVTVY